MNKEKPLISIIVPVYNTEKFLKKCLDSILEQTYKNLEIIVVNDATTDNSVQIIKDYIELDDRVRLIFHNENKGLFQARITGVEASRGEYIAFVDSDDHVSIDWYRLLVKKAMETNSDIVIGDFVDEYEDGRTEYYNLDNLRVQDLNLDGEEVLDTFMKQQGLFFGWHTVWNKLYRRDLWDKCALSLKNFSEEAGHLVMTEDIAFSCVFWSKAKKVTNIHNAYYFYVHHEGQSVATGNYKKFEKNVKNVVIVLGFFKDVLVEKGDFEKYEQDYLAWTELYLFYWSKNAKEVEPSEENKAKELVFSLFNVCKWGEWKNCYGFFYNVVTNIYPQFGWYENIKRDICDNRTKYISFDIFDTLILRPFFEPQDLFKLLNMPFNLLCNTNAYIDFAQIRIEAEKTARNRLSFEKPSYEDVNLDEIYFEIEKNYPFSRKTIEKMKQLEIELEIRFCTERKCGKELYELANFCGKQVIFTSDMYLPFDIVKQILSKNGYEGQLFLSSKERLLKGSGNLYRYIIKTLNTKPDYIVHIGDNWQVDFEVANNIGIKSHFLPKAIEQLKGTNPGTFSGKMFEKISTPTGNIYDVENSWKYLGIRSMAAVVANKMFDNPYTQPFNLNSDFNANPYYIGYFTLGMHLYAVTNWLIKSISNNQIDTIHFIGRDGYLPKKAYDILSGKAASKSNYLHNSRKAILTLQCISAADVYSMLGSINFFVLSPEKTLKLLKDIIVIEKFNLAETICKNNNIIYDKNFNSFDEIIKFLGVLYEEFIDAEIAKKLSCNFTKEFSKIIKPRDVFFDMGYSGRNEFVFSKLLNRPVDTYYVHTNSDVADIRSSIAGFKINTFYDYRPTTCVVLREHLFSALEPSCIGYNYSDNGKFIPIFEEYKHNYPTDFITTVMQNAALDFIEDMKSIFDGYEDMIVYKNLDASIPYEYFLHYAKEFDRYMFAESTFEDDVFGGNDINFLDFWNNEIGRNKLNPRPTEYDQVPEVVKEITVEVVKEVPVEVKVPISYEEFLNGQAKWKKALFMALFDKKLFSDNVKKRFKREENNE